MTGYRSQLFQACLKTIGHAKTGCHNPGRPDLAHPKIKKTGPAVTATHFAGGLEPIWYCLVLGYVPSECLQLRLGARPGAFSMRLRVNKVANFVVESAGQSKAASNQGICRGDKMATQGGYPQSGKEFEEYDSPELMVGGSVGIGLRVDVGALIERGAGRNLCPEFDLEALDVEPTDAPLADGFSEEDRPLSPTRLWATEQQGTASPVFTPTPTPLTTPTPELTGSMQTKENPPSKKRKNKKANGERAKRRKEDSVNKPYDYLEHLAKKQRRFIQGENAVHTLLDTLSLPHASSGFVGRVESSGSRAWTLDRVYFQNLYVMGKGGWLQY
ncbi:hypothetical protein BD779DRAFT_1480828 [Infundibulicybe gibba]|nr:hypothetical protein BD779DRAFT_1480828 [Infundibulicybe gibba]